QDYLEIERTRHGERLRYRLDIQVADSDPEVPPFCLQTLAENSVKHVASVRREGAEVRISASSSGGHLVLEVSDDGPGFDATALPRGHGIDNLKDRLESLYNGAAQLEITRRDGQSVVTLTLPLSQVSA